MKLQSAIDREYEIKLQRKLNSIAETLLFSSLSRWVFLSYDDLRHVDVKNCFTCFMNNNSLIFVLLKQLARLTITCKVMDLYT